MRRDDPQAVDRRCRLGAIPVGAFIAIASAAALSSAATHDVAISLATNDDGRRVFEVRSDHKTLAPVEDQLKRSFAVYVVFDSAPADPPPLAGDYSVVDGAIRFKPRFPLEPGMRYKAVFRSGGRKLTQEFVIPARAAAPAARVRAIYPTARVLPQNQLKFYLQFTAPMGRGDAYRHLTLLDAKGEAVVAVPLNDSLTSFRIEVIADVVQGAQAALFGDGQATIAATQDLQIVSGVPPLVREGDRYKAMFTLRNTSKAAIKASLAATAGAQALPTQTVPIAAGAAADVAWDVDVPFNVSSLAWTVAADAGAVHD
ncbi:MAG: alpha-2-macroglobulin family protein, partial [Stellaceae bacterium]